MFAVIATGEIHTDVDLNTEKDVDKLHVLHICRIHYEIYIGRPWIAEKKIISLVAIPTSLFKFRLT